MADDNSVKPLQKTITSDSVILGTSSRSVAVGSLYSITTRTVTAVKIKLAVWKHFADSAVIIVYCILDFYDYRILCFISFV